MQTSLFFPTSRGSRHSSFANTDAQRPAFQNTTNGGSSSFSSVSSANSSVSSNSSFSSAARSSSFSAGTVTLPTGRADDYSLGASLFNQSTATVTTPKASTASSARPSYLSSPTPHSAIPATFRRASSIELEHGHHLHSFPMNYPFSGSVTPQRFSPLVGNSTSSVTVGGPTSSPSSNNSSATHTPSHDFAATSSSSVLDRFANLAQVTREAELISNGMKQLELNVDATPISEHPHSNHQSRHGSISSNFFPSPSVSSDVYSPFVSPSISHTYSRSNSVTASSMWQHQTPVSSGSVSTVVSPSGLATVQIDHGAADHFTPSFSAGVNSTTHSPLFDPSNVGPAITRTPMYPHYPSVFSSPANSNSGMSDNWPTNNHSDEFAYKSPSIAPQPLESRTQSSAQNRTPPARPLSRLANAGANGINSDKNLRQQLAHQQQAQVQANHAHQNQNSHSRQHSQSHTPKSPPSFRFNGSQSFHPQNSENSISSRSGQEFNHSRGGNNNHRKNAPDYGMGLRSPLLEEFRGNKQKKYDISDIYGHVVEFSGDQYGSRFIQQRLELATTEEKQIIFEEISTNSFQLMTDVFGNYVIQKFFELGDQLQKTIMAKQMEGNILNLSLQMYGCRVVQKAIEHILTDQQAVLIKELDGHVLKCVRDQNGNHVIQKAIERIPAEHIDFIIKAFHSQVYNLATHPYGCRVIQRMLEYCDENARNSILSEIHEVTFELIEDQYGNYVIQHVIERGQPKDREQVMTIVRTSILPLSRHKYASNVVEKCIMYGTPEERVQLVDEILTPSESDGQTPFSVMMKDQFANYVIQKLLDVTKDEQHDRLVELIKPQIHQLKKYTYGKHVASIEKYVNNYTPDQKRGGKS